jgi:hypothetical protein
VKWVHLHCLYKTDVKPFTLPAGTALSVHVGEAMSKFLDALKRAEWLSAKRKDAKMAGPSTFGRTDRRMTGRIYVPIPLFIYGYTLAGNLFHEETCTIAINEGGGLISMTSRVQPGQRLVVTNEGNDQTQECVVVSVEAQLAHGNYIALKFSAPMPRFWRELEIGKSRAR